MSSPEFGFSFSPTQDNADQARDSAAASAPQGTIQTLNFRLPSIAGSAHSPSPLLSDKQVGSSFGGAVLQSVLRTVLGGDQASGYTDLSPASSGGRDEGQDILRMLGGGGSTMPTMPAGPGPSQGPVNTGQIDAPMSTMPDFTGAAPTAAPPQQPRYAMPDIPDWARYAGGAGFDPGSFGTGVNNGFLSPGYRPPPLPPTRAPGLIVENPGGGGGDYS